MLAPALDLSGSGRCFGLTIHPRLRLARPKNEPYSAVSAVLHASVCREEILRDKPAKTNCHIRFDRNRQIERIAPCCFLFIQALTQRYFSL